MNYKMKVGGMLDEAVCRALGIAYVDPIVEIDADLRSISEFPGGWPAVSTDWLATKLVWNALVAGNWGVYITHGIDGDGFCEATVYQYQDGVLVERCRSGYSPIEALCRAALAATTKESV